MDEHEDRWYEWLILPFAALVFVGAVVVLGIVSAMKVPRTAYRLVRRKMHNRIRVRSVSQAVRSRILSREFLLLTIVILAAIFWRFDHRQLVKERDKSDRSVAAFKDELTHLEKLAADLQNQLSSHDVDRLASVTEDELFRLRFDVHRDNRHNDSHTDNSEVGANAQTGVVDKSDTF